LTTLICKEPPVFNRTLGIEVESILVEGAKYHLLSVEYHYDKFYYTLIEFGSRFGFEADLFDVVDETPHWKQWQDQLILN